MKTISGFKSAATLACVLLYAITAIGQAPKKDCRKLIVGKWLNAANSSIVLEIRGNQWMINDSSSSKLATASDTFIYKGQDSIILYKHWYKYLSKQIFRVQYVDSSTMVLRYLGYTDNTDNYGWHGNWEDGTAYYVRHKDQLPPIMPPAKHTADTGKIWVGGKLKEVSQVAYYYNSLRQSMERQRWPAIVYVPSWQRLVVSSDEFGQNFENSFDIKVADSVPTDGRSEEELAMYEQGHDVVKGDADYLQIGPPSPGFLNPYQEEDVKLFYDAEGNPLLGINERNFGNHNTLELSYCFFYVLRQNKWVDITNHVLDITAAQQKWKAADIALINQYCNFTPEVSFHENTDLIYLALNDANNFCEQKVSGAKKAIQRKVCKILQQQSGCYNTLNRHTLQLSPLGSK